MTHAELCLKLESFTEPELSTLLYELKQSDYIPISEIPELRISSTKQEIKHEQTF